MIKSMGPDGKASVKFTLDPRLGARRASVCGEWNGWSADADIMRRDATGGFSRTIGLESGRAYRFRYLLDSVRWENDWDADGYVPNVFGSDDSIVDLTALGDRPATARTRRAVVKGSAKKATPPKKAAPVEKPAPAKTPTRKASKKDRQ